MKTRQPTKASPAKTPANATTKLQRTEKKDERLLSKEQLLSKLNRRRKLCKQKDVEIERLKVEIARLKRKLKEYYEEIDLMSENSPERLTPKDARLHADIDASYAADLSHLNRYSNMMRPIIDEFAEKKDIPKLEKCMRIEATNLSQRMRIRGSFKDTQNKDLTRTEKREADKRRGREKTYAPEAKKNSGSKVPLAAANGNTLRLITDKSGAIPRAEENIPPIINSIIESVSLRPEEQEQVPLAASQHETAELATRTTTESDTTVINTEGNDMVVGSAIDPVVQGTESNENVESDTSTSSA